MKHNSAGLARPCNANDLILVAEGLQCGNCLAVEYSTPMQVTRYWWVYATARPSGHRSKVGPFMSAVSAAAWAEEFCPVADWHSVSIQARNV